MSTAQLGIPFIPFTFSTVSFSRVAVNAGLRYSVWPYYSLWTWAEKGWSAYSAGRRSGAIPDHDAGWSSSAQRALRAAGMSERDAFDWLATADLASDDFWASGTWWRDFSGGGVPVMVRDLVDDAVTLTSWAGSAAGRALVGAVAGAAKNPWILITVAGVGVYVLKRKKRS